MGILDFFRRKITNPQVGNERGRESLYAILDEYYHNNTLYEFGTYISSYSENIKGLRTAVHRSVEFFSSHIATDVSVVAENESIKQAVQQFLEWSDFEDSKRKLIRQFALYGDIFLKIVNEEDKIYFQAINPKNVSKWEEDTKGNVTEMQIDSKVEVEETYFTRTEYWEKEESGVVSMKVWVHNLGINADVKMLGLPDEELILSDMGIDFIPIVHGKFNDFGDKFGYGCVTHALTKIDDLNRQATRLEQILFRYNKPIFAISSNANDANGRPIPAPKINVAGVVGDNIDIKDNTMFYLPGNATINPMIPNINYADALAILSSMAEEIEQDLPELRYFSLKTNGNLSGTAIRSLLQGAIDRAREAQDNLMNVLEEVNDMGLKIGGILGLFPQNLSNYSHVLDGGDVFPQDPLEMAQTLGQLVSAGIPLPVAMRRVGFTELEISELTTTV